MEKSKNKSRKIRMVAVLPLLLAVLILTIAVTASATHGPGPTPSDQSCTICPDIDQDGYRAYCDTSHVFDKSFSCGYPPPDCNDSDPWSHSYGSKDIASVKVEYSPTYVAKTQTEKKFTPDSKKFNPTLGDLLVTVTFKAKKCGMTTTPALVPMKVYYTTKDSSGNEVSLLLISATPDNRTLGHLAKVSDLVYQGLISESLDPRLLPTVEPYIASVAANRPVELKFVGPDIGPNKDTPKYQPLPMTNCAQVYGSGRHKVVYMRGESMINGKTVGQYIGLTTDVALRGFNATEPFKSNQGSFAHLVDLTLHKEKNIAVEGDDPDTADAVMGTAVHETRKVSSCKYGSQYFFIVNGTSGYGSQAFTWNSVPAMAIIDIDDLSQMMTVQEYPFVFLHEMAHAFAGVGDEYPFPCFESAESFLRCLNNPAMRDLMGWKKIIDQHSGNNNCSFNPKKDFSYIDKTYGLLNQSVCTAYDRFRPSVNSIMREVTKERRFNVVSCGYILKAIKKGGTAKSYFPECAAMAAKDGSIIPVGQ